MRGVTMIQNIKDKLRYLVDCRDKEESMERLKALGIEISESELEEIKQSLNKNSEHSSCLGMEQLEKVAGGMKRRRLYEGEEKKKKEEQTLGGRNPGKLPTVGLAAAKFLVTPVAECTTSFAVEPAFAAERRLAVAEAEVEAGRQPMNFYDVANDNIQSVVKNPKEWFIRVLKIYPYQMVKDRLDIIERRIMEEDASQGDETAIAALNLCSSAAISDLTDNDVFIKKVCNLYAAKTVKDAAICFNEEELREDLNAWAEYYEGVFFSYSEFINFLAKIDGRNGSDANTPTQISAEIGSVKKEDM